MMRAPSIPPLLLLASALLAPSAARSFCWDAFARDGVVQFLDERSVLRLYDLAAETWLPPVPLDDAVRAELAYGRVWFQRDGAVAFLDAASEVPLATPPGLPVQMFTVEDGHVFVLLRDTATQEAVLESYDAGSAAFESSVALPAGVYDGIATAPGGRVAVSSSSHGIFAVAFDDAGTLGEPAVVHPPNLFPTLRRSSSGDDLVAGAVTRFDADTFAVRETLDGYGLALVGDRAVVSGDGANGFELRLFDAERNLLGRKSTGPGNGYSALFARGDELFGIRCNDPASVERIDLESFQAPALGPPIPAAGPAERAYSFASSEEGIVYFLTGWEQRHVRRWLAAEDRFLSSIPLLEAPEAVTRAPGGGVFLSYESGRVSRIERSGEVEVPFATVPASHSSEPVVPLVAGPWIVLHDDFAWHVFGADGTWKSGRLPSHRTYAGGWDAVRERVFWSAWDGDRLGTFDLGSDGVLVPGPTVAFPPAPHLAASGDRLLAGATLIDLATRDVVATLPFPFFDYPIPLWHTPDRLLTLSGRHGEPVVYREWSKDGVLREDVELPGTSAVDLLPLGDEVVLVRDFSFGTTYDDVVFTRIRPGADLDGDGAPNDADVFPIDPTETADRDGDGVGDNADPNPDDPNDSVDTDGDGLGDVRDFLPEVAAERVALVNGKDWIAIVGLGRAEQSVSGQLHLLADGVFAFCTRVEVCLSGAWVDPGRGKPIRMRIPPEVLEPFAETIERGISNDIGRNVRFRFVGRARASAKTAKDGAVTFTLRAPHRVAIARAGVFGGAYRVRAQGEWLD